MVRLLRTIRTTIAKVVTGTNTMMKFYKDIAGFFIGRTFYPYESITHIRKYDDGHEVFYRVYNHDGSLFLNVVEFRNPSTKVLYDCLKGLSHKHGLNEDRTNNNNLPIYASDM
jgi:hypothetical protein